MTSPPIFSVLHGRAVLREEKEVSAFCSNPDELAQALMAAATEIPAQLLLLLLGVFKNKTNKACTEKKKRAKGCLKASRLARVLLAPLCCRDGRTSRGKGFGNTCVPYREGT